MMINGYYNDVRKYLSFRKSYHLLSIPEGQENWPAETSIFASTKISSDRFRSVQIGSNRFGYIHIALEKPSNNLDYFRDRFAKMIFSGSTFFSKFDLFFKDDRVFLIDLDSGDISVIFLDFFTLLGFDLVTEL